MTACRSRRWPIACSRATRAPSRAPFPSSKTSRPKARRSSASSIRAPGRAYLHRRHRPAGRRQEHARRSADRRDTAKPGKPSACCASIRRARTRGGAILGDRVRMQAHAEDRRRVHPQHGDARPPGRAGARRPPRPRIVLDAAGYDVVIIETVGVGQDEVDIVRTADVSIVTLVPGAGDEVQALKAGIMEIADIFVVNKADREGADRTAASIETMLSLEQWPEDAWRPPVLRTVATTGAGVAELVETIERFRAADRRRRSARGGARAPSGGCARSSAGASCSTSSATCWRPASSTRCSIASPRARSIRYARGADGDRSRRATGSRPARLDRRRRDRRSITSASPCATRPELVAISSIGCSVSRRTSPRTSARIASGSSTPAARRSSWSKRPTPTRRSRSSSRSAARPAPPLPPRAGHRRRAWPAASSAASQFIDEQPRPGAHGSRIAFIHPASAGGLLVELKQK